MRNKFGVILQKGLARCVGAVLLSVMLWQGVPAAAGSAFFEAVAKPGHYVLLRHALAPGVGDPQNFELSDCGTQRNLSDTGRAQARAIGEAFRGAGLTRAELFSSQWCRCLETTRLLELGPVRPLRSLNSFFQQPGEAASQMAALRDFLHGHPWQGPTVLVTHQVVITALTDVFPASGEALVVHRQASGSWRVVARQDF